MEKRYILLGTIWIKNWKLGDKLYSEWMLDYPEEYGEYIMVNPNEIILTKSKNPYKIIIDYPLKQEYHEYITLDHDLTREEVIDILVKIYQKIYKKELTNVIDGRSSTYGIWGHGLSDLIMHCIWVDENNTITVGVSS